MNYNLKTKSKIDLINKQKSITKILNQQNKKRKENDVFVLCK